MSTKPWRQAQEAARSIASRVADELDDLGEQFDRNEIGAADFTSKVALTVATYEGLVETALRENLPPLHADFNVARRDHNETRIGARNTIRQAVVEFMRLQG